MTSPNSTTYDRTNGVKIIQSYLESGDVSLSQLAEAWNNDRRPIVEIVKNHFNLGISDCIGLDVTVRDAMQNMVLLGTLPLSTPVVKTQDGLEAEVKWTCPKCNHTQTDSVHPELGPFFSATCGECGQVSGDESLSKVDQIAWEQARQWADANACKWTDGENNFTGPHQFTNGKCATCGEVE